MDWEKKYKEALKKAKNGEKIEDIFPEMNKEKNDLIVEDIIKIISDADLKNIESRYYDMINWLNDAKKFKAILWDGTNLKEMIEFTGLYKEFPNEWFKDWDEYEKYVHEHNNIFKLFCSDGSHYEIPVGTWLIKTPDHRLLPSNWINFVNTADRNRWTSKDDETVKEIIEYLNCWNDFDHGNEPFNEYIARFEGYINWMENLKNRMLQ